MTDILTIGDTSIDEFLKVNDATLNCDVNHENCRICFNYADKIPVEEFHKSVAGNAPNVAIGCSKLGLKAAVYSELGDDLNADLAIDTLEKEKIDTKFCLKNKGKKTNVHPIIVFKGERTIFSFHEAIPYKMQNWEKPKIIYYTSMPQGFKEFQNKLIEYLNKDEDIIFAMNPGSTMLKTGIEALRESFSRLDILFLNKEEAEKLVDDTKSEILELHKKLHKLGIKLSVITDNTNGSSAYDGEKQVTLGICVPQEIVDKTGAGDAYASGFISAIFHKKSLKDAMKWGAINSASVITKIGSIHGLRNLDHMEEFARVMDFSESKIH